MRRGFKVKDEHKCDGEKDRIPNDRRNQIEERRAPHGSTVKSPPKSARESIDDGQYDETEPKQAEKHPDDEEPEIEQGFQFGELAPSNTTERIANLSS